MNGRFRRFVVIAGMRTGSNLLERTLSQFPSLVCHGELFNPAFIGKKDRTEFLGVDMAARERDPTRLLAAMDDDAAGRLPGFRIFDGHDARVMQSILEDPTTAKVLLRRDPLHSFVSLLIARATDQWMLGNAAKRRTARVMVDAKAFRAFKDERDAFERKVLNTLRISGQVPFVIQYTELKSLDVLNGLARFLGAEEQLDELAEPIKRQNPEPLSQKVENYADLPGIVAAGSLDEDEQPGPPPRGPGVPAVYTAVQKSLLYAPIPGVPKAPVVDWLNSLGGVTDGHNRSTLNTWLDDNPGHLAFTVVAHPLVRAWSTFVRRIVPTGNEGYPKIRRRLTNHHGLALPDDPTNWPVAERAAAFEAFLVFLKNNIAGQTGIRIDPEWAPQGDFVASLSGAVYLGAVFRGNEGRAQLAAAAGAQEGPAALPVPAGLEAIHSTRLENLARGAYPHDYRRFGFADWSPG